ncbi:Fic family protein [Paraburkholderia terricola]|uniref:Fic family protein n=1 Tax=Paraburkholderia terricola TaxID=169427 RepID=UPI003ED00C55
MCPEHNRACPCSSWDYRNYDDNRHTKVRFKEKLLLADLKSGAKGPQDHLSNTRGAHKAQFSGLTAKGCEYFAGNYRGSRGCLVDYEVTIGTDIVTTHSSEVAAAMDELHALIDSDVRRMIEEAELRAIREIGVKGTIDSEELSVTDADVSAEQEAVVDAEEDMFIKNLDVALEHMVNFMAIHPYADGNGHMGRFMLFCFLCLMGMWPEKWPIDERPPAPYDYYIKKFREGFPDPLREFVIEQIVG